MTKATSAAVISPMTLVPLGCVLACAAGLFGIARWVGQVDIKTETTAQRTAEVREWQLTTAKDINDRLDDQGRALGDLKNLQATSSAQIGMLIEHFGIEPRKRR